MKKRILILALLVASLSAHAQETPTTAPAETSTALPLLMERQWYDGKQAGSFQLSDGSILTDEDAITRLKLCPENRAIMPAYASWSATATISTWGFVLGFLAEPALIDAGVLTKDNLAYYTVIGGILATTSIISTHNAGRTKNLAMQNYNLYIMGIPIPHK